jgi:nitrogen fixation/metabolism regulation signal transduction histidine kinase
MKKIRSKITLIFFIIVFLPLIPISVLVYNLINQSYRMGVNPQIQQALEDGLTSSKELYDWQRNQLSKNLDQYVDMLEKRSGRIKYTFSDYIDISDTSYWIYRAMVRVDQNGNELERFDLETSKHFLVDIGMLNELKLSGKDRMIVSNRRENLYTVLRKFSMGKADNHYFILQASIKQEILDRADNLLAIHQIYQTLDLSRNALMKSYLYTFIVIVLILVLLAIGAGIMISSRITSRISQIVAATAELGSGNLEYRLPSTTRKDELSRLMSQFNMMAEQLKENQDRLIYLEKMATWQLMARKIAHEIKNPLTPIQLTIQQLVDKYNNSGDDYDKLLHECADIIHEEISSLRHLVSEFSEFGRLPELVLREGDMNELIQEVAALYGDRVRLKLTQEDNEIRFDTDRIRRVLINLLENAVQSDPGNHPIVISTLKEDSSFCLMISDQGEGISQENLAKIFEPYFSEKKDGTGLGLTITRLIVEEHGGSIQVESSPGKGSTFFLYFPLQRINTDE